MKKGKDGFCERILIRYLFVIGNWPRCAYLQNNTRNESIRFLVFWMLTLDEMNNEHPAAFLISFKLRPTVFFYPVMLYDVSSLNSADAAEGSVNPYHPGTLIIRHLVNNTLSRWMTSQRQQKHSSRGLELGRPKAGMLRLRPIYSQRMIIRNTSDATENGEREKKPKSEFKIWLTDVAQIIRCIIQFRTVKLNVQKNLRKQGAKAL